MAATSSSFSLTHLRPPINSRPKTRTQSTSLFLSSSSNRETSKSKSRAVCKVAPRKSISASQPPVPEGDENVRLALHYVMWSADGVYILWLFLLAYAPVYRLRQIVFSTTRK